MNILFLTLVEIDTIDERGIFEDLLRKFKNEGHDLTVVTSKERRTGIKTNLKISDGVTLLQVKTLNIQKNSILEKGIGILAVEFQYLKAVKKYLNIKKFDLILYTTPPITFVKVINYIKRRDNAYAYLLLKDIFPQNAVDLNFIKKDTFIHKYFRKKEKALYEISDTIGCMSPANINYLLKNNPELDAKNIEINPNVIEPIHFNPSLIQKEEIRVKYQLPLDKKILVYGGNLGKPQGLSFLLESILTIKNEKCFFLIVGSGTEYSRINEWFIENQPKNAMLISKLSKKEYDQLLSTCDIGLLFLDNRFTIPNFPSRLLSYLEMKLPIIAATDAFTDIGTIIEEHNCGYKVLAGDKADMKEKVESLLQQNLEEMGENAYNLLINNYTVEISYQKIIEKLKPYS
ncbi:MAG TPA: glycosyltransferase family 4 protein [Edaphocola sp.]|nr:glycosyltransferase family 4 protein [Edaphocola sp.]